VKATRKTSDALAAASMWCVKIQSGGLTGEDRVAFDDWRQADPKNQALVNEMLGVWSALDEVTSSPAMIDIRGDALRDFRKAQAASVAVRFSRRRMWGSLAATLVLTGGSVWGWETLHRDSYKTLVGERRDVVLSDGSRLALDSDTIVEVKYAGGQRRLWLQQGRAKFSVAKDPLHPFSVTAGEKTVVATGTEFSVERVAQQVRVVLYEGHVAVLSGREDAPQRPSVRIDGQAAGVSLSPNQELVTSQGSDRATVAGVEPTHAGAWEAGRLVFENEPLGLAVARVNRYTQNKVRIGTLRDPAVRVSGFYRAGDTPAFVDGVSAVSGLHYRVANGEYILESKEN
jgi:transmembrane sensor